MSIAELTRNAVHVLPEGALEAKLKLGRPLRIKLGIDPTCRTSTSVSPSCSAASRRFSAKGTSAS